MPGTNVQQYESNDTDAQKWKIENNNDGTYSLKSKCNGLYLDISSGITYNGNNVQVFTGNGTNAQKFKFIKCIKEAKIEYGIYNISSVLDSTVNLDIAESSQINGGNLQIWKNSANFNQQFKIQKGSDGYYTITARHSAKVLEASGAGIMPGTNVQQYTSNYTDAQKWKIEDNNDGTYSFISKCNGLYLDIANGQAINGNNMQLYLYNGTKAQKFMLSKCEIEIAIENGVYNISSAINTSINLDVEGASKDDKANLQLWEKAPNLNQEFNIKKDKEGYYTITALHSGKAIEVSGGGVLPGSNIQQYTLNNTDAQKWKFIDNLNGTYSIKSKCSNLYMDIPSGIAYNGNNVQIFTPNGTNAQRFILTKLQKYAVNIDVVKYPGYKEKIESLMSNHPNWSFEFLYTGLKFSDVIEGEYAVHKANLVPSSYGGEWISGTTLYDSGWYGASKKAIAYYMDSRNFLDDINVFQFLDVNDYSEGSCTLEGIQNKVTNTYLSNYSEDINIACKNKDVNPYYIIARLIQEQGSKGGCTVKMDGGDGKFYYNPFNINASGDGVEEIKRNALSRAKSEGWDTMGKALEGGIDFCKKNWLENYQNTLYQNKFDIDSTNGTKLYSHQYMQNLLAAYNEARNLRSMYYNTGKVDSDFVFQIPLYEEMGSELSQMPNSNGTWACVKTRDGRGCWARSEPSTSKGEATRVKLLNEGASFIIIDLNTTYDSGYNWYKIVLMDGTNAYIPKEYTEIN